MRVAEKGSDPFEDFEEFVEILVGVFLADFGFRKEYAVAAREGADGFWMNGAFQVEVEFGFRKGGDGIWEASHLGRVAGTGEEKKDWLQRHKGRVARGRVARGKVARGKDARGKDARAKKQGGTNNVAGNHMDEESRPAILAQWRFERLEKP